MAAIWLFNLNWWTVQFNFKKSMIFYLTSPRCLTSPLFRVIALRLSHIFAYVQFGTRNHNKNIDILGIFGSKFDSNSGNKFNYGKFSSSSTLGYQQHNDLLSKPTPGSHRARQTNEHHLNTSGTHHLNKLDPKKQQPNPTYSFLENMYIKFENIKHYGNTMMIVLASGKSTT